MRGRRGRGLSRLDGGTGTLIRHAAQPGPIAATALGVHSLSPAGRLIPRTCLPLALASRVLSAISTTVDLATITSAAQAYFTATASAKEQATMRIGRAPGYVSASLMQLNSPMLETGWRYWSNSRLSELCQLRIDCHVLQHCTPPSVERRSKNKKTEKTEKTNRTQAHQRDRPPSPRSRHRPSVWRTGDGGSEGMAQRPPDVRSKKRQQKGTLCWVVILSLIPASIYGFRPAFTTPRRPSIWPAGVCPHSGTEDRRHPCGERRAAATRRGWPLRRWG